MEKLRICILFTLTLLTFLIELQALPQVIKFAPVEDWIAFKGRSSDIKPLDKFLGKLRATYDFVFHKPENVSNVGKILSKVKSLDPSEIHPYKFVLSESHVADEVPENEKKDVTKTSVYVELLVDDIMSAKESSISRVATDWLDEVQVSEIEPLSELEILNNDSEDDDDDTDVSVKTGSPHSGFELSATIARAFIRWLSSVIGFTHGAYLKLSNVTSSS